MNDWKEKTMADQATEIESLKRRLDEACMRNDRLRRALAEFEKTKESADLERIYHNTAHEWIIGGYCTSMNRGARIVASRGFIEFDPKQTFLSPLEARQIAATLREAADRAEEQEVSKGEPE